MLRENKIKRWAVILVALLNEKQSKYKVWYWSVESYPVCPTVLKTSKSIQIPRLSKATHSTQMNMQARLHLSGAGT